MTSRTSWPAPLNTNVSINVFSSRPANSGELVSITTMSARRPASIAPMLRAVARVPAVQMRGNHGYDNDAPDMRAIFIAAGPSFRAAGRLRDFDNLAIEPLVRRLVGLPPGKRRDGSVAPLRKALRNR